MDNIFSARVEAVRALMQSNGWDILILTGSDPHASEYPAPRWQQVCWVSGFTGEAGDLVITRDHAGLWTDTRYFIQANTQLAGTGIQLHKMRVPEQVSIPEWIASLQMEAPVIAVDGLCQTVSAIHTLQKAVPSATVVPVPDLLSTLWKDRPAIPSTPIITLGEDLTGESREAKIHWLRKWMMLQEVDAIFLTALDEIAWLLNVRGSDVDYNPLVISYLLVTMDDVYWFVRKDESQEPDEETQASFQELLSDEITLCAYEEAGIALSTFVHENVDRIFVDPGTLNIQLRATLEESGYDVLEGLSPIPLRKSIKNNVEIAGMREAHLEDGLAMEKFLYWLEGKIGQVDEWEAACKLQSFRAEIPGYRGDSFQTISAYGPGAALPHYVTPRNSAPVLEPHGLYLLDSGGQYLFGTTDITRTIPLGPCTALEKEDYTLVMKCHIDLSMAVFPVGTCGCHLDILARNPLWQTKRNFGHGTGHGVGFFLGVHEGPQEFRQNFNAYPYVPGIINTIEPGLYREGQHGVRHENVVLVRDAGTSEFGKWYSFETLTLCHYDTSVLVPDLMTPEEIAWLNAYNERVYRELSPRLPAEVAAWLREKTRPV